MRLHRVPWRSIQRTGSLNQLVTAARAGNYSRLTIARDGIVKYREPLGIAGNTSAAAAFIPALIGQKWYWVPEIDLIALPGCVFTTQHSVPIFKNFLVCDELEYNSDVRSLGGFIDSQQDGLTLNGAVQDRIRQAAWVPEGTLFVHPRFHQNYTHWHTEALTQLDVIGAIAGSVGAIGVPRLQGFKRASVDLWGDPGKPVVELTEPAYRTALGFVLTHSLFRTWLHPATARALKRLRSAAHARVGVQDAAARYPVYLSRQDSKFRPVGNEADVCAALAARGFRIVIASELTFEEQARTFAEASLIVSPHGSGLTNMIYARPETPVLELRPMHAKGRSPFFDRSWTPPETPNAGMRGRRAVHGRPPRGGMAGITVLRDPGRGADGG
ncbi:glycosyltransferase family 61 protein, partial [Roseomonas rosulenta]|uniref:glycosyltransferase family 61 protein n=1 Tax=Roseomonas rosulenta TaxID=2748667 RepID=UPI0018DF12AE